MVATLLSMPAPHSASSLLLHSYTPPLRPHQNTLDNVLSKGAFPYTRLPAASTNHDLMNLVLCQELVLRQLLAP